MVAVYHSRMMIRSCLALNSLILLFTLASGTAGESPSPLMVKTDKIVFQSDFSEPANLKKQGWIQRQATRWEIKEGKLLGIESTAENQAKKSHHRGFEPRISAKMCPEEYACSFSVRFFEGAATTIVPFVEFGHHIVRARFDAEAGMSLLVDYETLKVAEAPDFKWVPGKWYHALAELKGDEFVIQFVNGPTLYAKHPILREPAPSGGTGFGLAGPKHGKVEIDDFTVYSIQEGTQPDWETTRKTFPVMQPVTVREHPKK